MQNKNGIIFSQNTHWISSLHLDSETSIGRVQQRKAIPEKQSEVTFSFTSILSSLAIQVKERK